MTISVTLVRRKDSVSASLEVGVVLAGVIVGSGNITRREDELILSKAPLAPRDLLQPGNHARGGYEVNWVHDEAAEFSDVCVILNLEHVTAVSKEWLDS